MLTSLIFSQNMMTEWELLSLTRLQLYDIESGLEMGDAMDVGRKGYPQQGQEQEQAVE